MNAPLANHPSRPDRVWRSQAAMNEPGRSRAADYLSLAKTQRRLSHKYLAWAAEDLASATMQWRGMRFFQEAKKLRQRARDSIQMARKARNRL